MIPLNGNIILKEVQEKKIFKNIIIPQQYAANQITFGKIVALPKEKIFIHDLKVDDYVVLGHSPVWHKKYSYKIDDNEYLIVPESSILAIIRDNELLELIDVTKV